MPPRVDMRTLVAEHITVVRGSAGWVGFFLQERRGPAGHLEIPGGTRQHVVVCYLRPVEVAVTANGRTRRIAYQAGDSRLVPAGTPLRFAWRSETRMLLLGLEPAFTEAALARFGEGARDLAEAAWRVFPAGHAVSQLMQLAAGELARGPAGRAAASGYAQAIVAHLFIAAPTPRLDNEVSAAAVRRAVAHLRAHLAETVSVADLAAAARLSPAHFARRFKAATGLPPHEYQLRLRVARAQEMLTAGGHQITIAAIAAECGFANQSHLGRVFKRVTGATPAAYLR